MSKKDDNNVDDKMKRLEELKDWFAGEEFRLSEAAAKYKEAVRLNAEIKRDLEKLTNEIEVLEDR